MRAEYAGNGFGFASSRRQNQKRIPVWETMAANNGAGNYLAAARRSCRATGGNDCATDLCEGWLADAYAVQQFFAETLRILSTGKKMIAPLQMGGPAMRVFGD
jgi:hypothetical protein